MKCEHKSNEENGDESDNELTREALAENDADFRADMEKEESDDHHFKGDGRRSPQEIHIIIEQPQKLDKLQGTEESQVRENSGDISKQVPVKCDEEADDKVSERPYACDICGRRFKEVSYLQFHAFFVT